MTAAQAQTEQQQAPGPGVYLDGEISDEAYFTLPYASKSGLWRVHLMPDTIQTLEQARAWVKGGPPTYAMRLGRAFDDAMQYGDGWRDNWIAGPVNPSTGKGYGGDTKKFQAFVAEHGENVIVPEDMDTIDMMREAMVRHPDVRPLIEHPKARHQVVVIWRDERTGQMCKAKVDLWTARGGVSTHVDWKTWTKLKRHVSSEYAFAWEAQDRGYDIQATHYIDGCRILDSSTHRDFAIAAINKNPAIIEATGEILYEVDVLDFTEEQLEGALRVRDALLEKWISIQNGTWKPTRRGVRAMKFSNHRENDYGSRPLY